MPTYIPIQNTPIQLQDTVTSVNMSSGTLEFYDAGTTTAQNVYSDSSGTLVGTTVTLDSGGFPASGGNVITLFRDQSKTLKIVGKNAAGATIFTSDNIPAVASFDATSSTKLAGIEAGADVTDATNVGAVVNGKQQAFIRPQDMYLPTTGAAAALAQVEGIAGFPVYSGFAFDGASEEYVEFAYAFPNRYNNSTVTYQVFWTSAATDSDGVTWGLKAVSRGDGETIASVLAPYGTGVTVDDTLQGGANILYLTAESSALTIAGAAPDGDLTWFRVYRHVSNVNDTASEDAVLLGVKLFWTSDALNDA